MIENWKNIFGKFQVRILVVYCLLILLSFSGAVFAIRRVLLFRLDERIEQALNQEVQEFQLLVDGKNPDTAEPFGDNIEAIFQVFLRRNIPITDEYTIALLPDRFYASVPTRLPPLIRANSRMVKHWQNLTVNERGKIVVASESIVYRAEPITINGEIKGVFVVAISEANQRQEIQEAMLIIFHLTMIAVAITSILAWIFAGKILTPLRLLTKTAQAISENNLNQRIPVEGNDEVTQLSLTFNEMLNRLQSAFVTQQKFLSDVSHELKTPITIIQGHLEVMGNTPADRQETKELVFDELERMNRLISDLTLLAKSEQPNFVKLDLVKLENLTQEIYSKVQAIAKRQWLLESVGQGNVLVDRQRLVQAMTNLAQNATKHTKSQDIIAVGSRIKQNWLYLWVRDTGTGIAESDRQRIFQRFQTGSQNNGVKGTGLGLSIVSAIAKAHGGKIELFSRLGQGSQFTVVIPMQKNN
jgi:signal transduction histidine kinase